jgi:hypothetical protein
MGLRRELDLPEHQRMQRGDDRAGEPGPEFGLGRVQGIAPMKQQGVGAGRIDQGEIRVAVQAFAVDLRHPVLDLGTAAGEPDFGEACEPAQVLGHEPGLGFAGKNQRPQDFALVGESQVLELGDRQACDAGLFPGGAGGLRHIPPRGSQGFQPRLEVGHGFRQSRQVPGRQAGLAGHQVRQVERQFLQEGFGAFEQAPELALEPTPVRPFGERPAQRPEVFGQASDQGGLRLDQAAEFAVENLPRPLGLAGLAESLFQGFDIGAQRAQLLGQPPDLALHVDLQVHQGFQQPAPQRARLRSIREGAQHVGPEQVEHPHQAGAGGGFDGRDGGQPYGDLVGMGLVQSLHGFFRRFQRHVPAELIGTEPEFAFQLDGAETAAIERQYGRIERNHGHLRVSQEKDREPGTAPRPDRVWACTGRENAETGTAASAAPYRKEGNRFIRELLDHEVGHRAPGRCRHIISHPGKIVRQSG